MYINVFINFFDNKVILSLTLPNELCDINDDKYFELDDSTIYEENVDKFNFNDFIKNMNLVIEKVKKAFPNTNIIYDSNNINFNMSDSFAEDIETLYKFIKNNKNLNITIDVTEYKELIEHLKDNELPNLKISFKNSYETLSYKEFYKMHSKLNEIIEFINHYNLSPLEKVLLVYDIVKANEYKKESLNESYSKSRSLNEIINGDKIVCVGFSNLMDYLLKNLEFNSGFLTLDYNDKESGHIRNYIHLIDEKYNIDGVFFLDATWDCKTNENYLDNYSFFLKSLRYFKAITKNEKIESPKMFKIVQKNKTELLEYINNLEKNDLLKFSVQFKDLVSIYDNNYYKFFDFSKLTKEQILELISKLYSKYNKKIDKEKFKNALYKVRRIEYLNKIINFEPNEEYINFVCDKYYKLAKEQYLLAAIFGEFNEPTLEKSLDDSKANSVEEDLLRIRLLRSLKEKLQDFPNNDYIKKM